VQNEPAFDPALRDAPVLVTGGAGFIGSHLTERLVAAEARVTVLDNLQAGRLDNLQAVRDKITYLDGDVRNSEALHELIGALRPHFVFHLAANASVPGSVQDPVYDFQANAVGTFNLLDALRNAPECRKVVIASSGAVYGEPATFPITETDPLQPISPYGASKLSSEVSARISHRVYKVPVVIARLFNTYGPRMARFVVLDFLRKLHRDAEQLEVLGTGRQVRDFTYVADTVSGLLLLAQRGLPGESYNVSSGVNYSVTELAEKLIEARGLRGKTQIRYTGSSWVGDAQRWEVSIERISTLGYRSCYSLDDGLRETLHWFLENEGRA
jgi:UDP-glucose 4-epimerase